MVSLKYCPDWLYDCVVAQIAIDFILYNVEVVIPARKFSMGLSEKYQSLSAEELASSAELVIRFLAENQVNENSIDLLCGFGFFRFYYITKTRKRSFNGLFNASKKSDSQRN